MSTLKKSRVFILEPAGLFDVTSNRIMQYAGREVQKVQPFGCPRNGTMRMCYVQTVEEGEFIGLVNESSLRRTNRTAPVRDRAAEAREARSRQIRASINRRSR